MSAGVPVTLCSSFSRGKAKTKALAITALQEARKVLVVREGAPTQRRDFRDIRVGDVFKLYEAWYYRSEDGYTLLKIDKAPENN